jgi:hypothetical protein
MLTKRLFIDCTGYSYNTKTQNTSLLQFKAEHRPRTAKETDPLSMLLDATKLGLYNLGQYRHLIVPATPYTQTYIERTDSTPDMLGPHHQPQLRQQIL